MDVSSDTDEREPLMSAAYATASPGLQDCSSCNPEGAEHEPPPSSMRSRHTGLHCGFGTMAPPLLWSVVGYWDPDCPRQRRDTESSGLEISSDGASDEGSRNMSLRAKISLSLVAVTYFLGYIPSMVIMNPYIYDRVAEDYDYEVNTSSELPCATVMIDFTSNISIIQIQDEIEREVSTLELYLHLTSYLTAILPILLLGPITDKFGRRAGFLLPISGTLVKQIIYIVVIGLKLPIPFLYLAHAIEALGGSFAAMLTTIFSVTSDLTTSGQQRSRWIALMEALQTISATLGQVYTAQWMRQDYTDPLMCALGNCCLAFLLSIFLLPETYKAASGDPSNQSTGIPKSDAIEGSPNDFCSRALKWGSICWKTVQTSVNLYTKHDSDTDTGTNSRQPSSLCKRRLCLGIFICTVAVNMSHPGVEALFQMKYPLCWAATKVYTFDGLRILLSWFAIGWAMVVMQRVFKMVDRQVAIVGVISSILSNAALSLATNDAMVYEAAAMGFMTRSVIPMLRSSLSSLVDPANQGAMYSSLGCFEALGAGIFSTAANRIYSASLSTWAGEIFMMFACVMILALVLLVALNVLFARETIQGNGGARKDLSIQEDREA